MFHKLLDRFRGEETEWVILDKKWSFVCTHLHERSTH